MATREDAQAQPAREDARGSRGSGQRTGVGGRAVPTHAVQPETPIPTALYKETSARRGRATDGDEQFANGLGWFSIGLGLAQILSPGSVARLIGVTDDSKSRSLMRTIGMREIATGVGILSKPRPANWVRARVGGDLMDLTLLGTALRSDDSAKGRVAITTAAVLGVTALDVMCSQRLRNGTDTATARRQEAGKERVAKAITIRKSPEDIYRFWRNFENLPRFMYHLQEVRVLDDRRSHWVAKAPAGSTVEWDAEIIEDQPSQRIAWRSLRDADVSNSGSVEFRRAPGDRGTEVHVEIRYEPPAGKLGKVVAKLFGEEPGQQVGDDLRRLKQVLETGEVVRSEALPEGQGRPYIAQRAAKHLGSTTATL